MIRDDRKLIRNRLGIEFEEVPEIAFVNYMVRTSGYTLIEDCLEDVKKLKPKAFLQPYATGYVGTIKDTRIIVFTGRIRHELLLVPLLKTNVKIICAFGLAGAVQRSLNVGDVVIPIASIKGEGLTQYYAPSEMPAVGDLAVLAALANAAFSLKVKYDTGIFYTTDSWLTEPEFIKQWSKLGVIGIERELAKHYILTSVYGKKAGGLYVITDKPIAGDKIWIEDNVVSECYKSIDKCTEILIASLKRFEEILRTPLTYLGDKDVKRKIS